METFRGPSDFPDFYDPPGWEDGDRHEYCTERDIFCDCEKCPLADSRTDCQGFYYKDELEDEDE
jgi:hypothetical protein